MKALEPFGPNSSNETRSEPLPKGIELFLERNVGEIRTMLESSALVKNKQIDTFRQAMVDFAVLCTVNTRGQVELQGIKRLLDTLCRLESDSRATLQEIQGKQLELAPLMMTLNNPMNNPEVSLMDVFDGRRFSLECASEERNLFCQLAFRFYTTYSDILEHNSFYCGKFQIVARTCIGVLLDFQKKNCPRPKPPRLEPLVAE
jgi:hypothetical protein